MKAKIYPYAQIASDLFFSKDASVKVFNHEFKPCTIHRKSQWYWFVTQEHNRSGPFATLRELFNDHLSDGVFSEIRED